MRWLWIIGIVIVGAMFLDSGDKKTGLGCTSGNNNLEDPNIDKTSECINSGGRVETSLCCNSVSNFPNTCSIGACGCAPENSHYVQICICSIGGCWNGDNCIEGGYSCADYWRRGIKETHCANCGDGICKEFERCVSTTEITDDCGGLYCPQDCIGGYWEIDVDTLDCIFKEGDKICAISPWCNKYTNQYDCEQYATGRYYKDDLGYCFPISAITLEVHNVEYSDYRCTTQI